MRNLETVLDHYIECALWSSTDNADESGGAPLDDNYGLEDIAPETLASMRADCESMIALECATHPPYDAFWSDAQFGHDFWLTRNRHGAGFWDRGWEGGDELTALANTYGGVDLYVGDDGMVHA